MPASTGKVLSLYKRLYQHYGPQKWWPADSAWEMMAGAILTQNTAWSNVEKALQTLRADGSLSAAAIARMPRRRLEKLIRSSGFFRQKAERLQKLARLMQKDRRLFQQLSGSAKGKLPGLRDRLLAQHGIGPETADSILLYAGGYPIFVVDAYTRRIGRRTGLLRTDDYEAIQNVFQKALPRKSQLYNEFHALLVRLAKQVCTSRKPLCEACPVRSGCAHGQGR